MLERRTTYEDLVDHLVRTTPLGRGEAGRVVLDVLAYFDETTEEFVRRRHRELQGKGLVNAEIFERTWQWIVSRQADPSGGEWFAEVLPDGSIRGAKADQWKAGYHNGRALLESIRLIGAL